MKMRRNLFIHFGWTFLEEISRSEQEKSANAGEKNAQRWRRWEESMLRDSRVCSGCDFSCRCCYLRRVNGRQDPAEQRIRYSIKLKLIKI